MHKSLAFALCLAVPFAGSAAPKADAKAAGKPEIVLHLSLAGCRVLLDGKEAVASAGQDLTMPAAAGEHLVRVEHEGFQPFEQKVVVAGSTRLDVLLKVADTAPPAPAEPAAAPKRQTGPIRVAVYEAKAVQKFEPRIIRLVSEALLAEVRKLERVSAVSTAEIGEMLSFEQQRQLLGCGDDSCLAEISGALGVDELVNASMGSVGDSNVFTLKRIDLRHAQVKGASNRRFKAGNGEEFLAAIGPAIEEAFPDYPLRPGKTRGVAPAVVARLNPPPLPRWLFAGTAGAAVVSILAAGGFAWGERSAEQQHADAVAKATAPGGSVDGWELKGYRDAAESRAWWANAFYIGAGTFALAAAVEAFFTDWHGYRELAAAPGSGDGISLHAAPGGIAGTF